ncbi:MAG: Acylphosphatase [Syntrophaceae bacterium PtaB.Bin095]|nr:MAG: Acylphosphatase [Syntrophaceae bacterium PtaB.Bin095]
MKRIRVTISGLVQGVAFRHETRKTALSLNLTGWVRNLPDGRVEAVFAGADESVAAMLSWCRKGPRLSRVRDVQVWEEAGSESFDAFEIRYG